MTAAAPAAPIGWRQRPVPAHTRTLVQGLSMIAGAVLVVIAAALAAGTPVGEAGFLLPFVLAPAIGAAVAWRYGTVGRSIGLVLGIGSAVMTFFLGFGLFVPASFVEFTTGTAWLLGVLMTLYGGIASIVRRRDLVTEPADSEVLLDRVALGLVVLALVVSLPLWLLGRTSVDAAAAEGLPEVAAANFSFEDVTVTAGEETQLVVRNTDPFIHTFTIDELGIDLELLPGSSAIVDLPATPGSWVYYCIPHSSDAGAGEDDMAGTLTIE